MSAETTQAARRPTAPLQAARRPDRGHHADGDGSSPGGTRGAHTEQRKQQLLTKGRASVVGSIADAVVAKDGEPFFLCLPDGQVPLEGAHGYGFYHHDCRFLSGYELSIAGEAPDSLVAAEVAATALRIELTNPDLNVGDRHIPKEQLAIRLTRRVDRSGPVLKDEIVVHNYGRDRVELPLDVRFRAGFEDVYLIRGLLDEQPGTCHDPEWQDGALVFRYEGGDDVDRFARVTFDPAPDDRRADGAGLRLALDAGAAATVHIEVALAESARDPDAGMEQRDSPDERRSDAGRQAHRTGSGRGSAADGWIGGQGWATSVRTTSFALRGALGRSLDDLAQLRGRLDGLRYYEAGVPWFATLFGRDALIAGLQSLAFDPEIVAESLRLLGSRRGRRVDDWRDEQPGKILHELRIGELARMGEIPHTPYYGSVDATPLFLVLLAAHANWTGSLDLFTELSDAVGDALAWLDGYGDTDGDGFIDYRSDTERGLVNQGWKDSGDAIVDEHGAIAEPPIALAEVQGYAWRAWRDMATLYDRAGDADRAGSLRTKADAMRDRFEERFWSDGLGCYVLALANGRACNVVASNAGQVLWTGIASAAHARSVADRLMRPDMFSGWGIRTLSAEAAAFHPVGYHLGTVWPHDNSMIASGFRRYGLDEAAERVFLGILEASGHFPHDRLPECFSGFDQEEFPVPVRYPVACHPQAWAAGSIPELLVSTLGLEPDGFANVLAIRRPRLPAGIERVEIRDLPVARGRVHVLFDRREDGSAAVEVVESTHGVEVTVGTATRSDVHG